MHHVSEGRRAFKRLPECAGVLGHGKVVGNRH
jgi:hypothetical protein